MTRNYHRIENGTTIRGGVADKWVPHWMLQARNIYAGVTQMGAISALLGAAPPSGSIIDGYLFFHNNDFNTCRFDPYFK